MKANENQSAARKALLLRGWEALCQPLVAIIFGLVVGAVVILACGQNPMAVYAELFEKSFIKPYYLFSTLTRATPIIICAMATGMSWRAGYINLGGNVLALGAKTDGSAYTIGIQRPFGEENEAIVSVSITDQTVVSSGVYERYFEVDGTRYHHILDTATGYPYDNGLLEVTIITDASVDGDGLSTTWFSLGLEDGMALVESLDATEAIFITDDYEVHTSSGMGTVIPYEILED